jgi:hypothetical protein
MKKGRKLVRIMKEGSMHTISVQDPDSDPVDP